MKELATDGIAVAVTCQVLKYKLRRWRCRSRGGSVNLTERHWESTEFGRTGADSVGGKPVRTAAAGTPVTSFHVANRPVISEQCSLMVSVCRPVRKCGEIALNTARNRCAATGERKNTIVHSRCLVGVRHGDVRSGERCHVPYRRPGGTM